MTIRAIDYFTPKHTFIINYGNNAICSCEDITIKAMEEYGIKGSVEDFEKELDEAYNYYIRAINKALFEIADQIGNLPLDVLLEINILTGRKFFDVMCSDNSNKRSRYSELLDQVRKDYILNDVEMSLFEKRLHDNFIQFTNAKKNGSKEEANFLAGRNLYFLLDVHNIKNTKHEF